MSANSWQETQCLRHSRCACANGVNLFALPRRRPSASMRCSPAGAAAHPTLRTPRESSPSMDETIGLQSLFEICQERCLHGAGLHYGSWQDAVRETDPDTAAMEQTNAARRNLPGIRLYYEDFGEGARVARRRTTLSDRPPAEASVDIATTRRRIRGSSLRGTARTALRSRRSTKSLYAARIRTRSDTEQEGGLRCKRRSMTSFQGR